MKQLIPSATLTFFCSSLFLAVDIKAGQFHPIVDVHSGILVGAVGEGRWLDHDRAAKLLRGGETYHVYGFDKSLGLATGGKLSRTIPAGSYSFVLLRRVAQNSVQTQLIEGEFHPKTTTEADPGAYKVSAVLHLEGDGKMEVIVSGVYVEGDSISVWGCPGTKPEKLLEVV